MPATAQPGSAPSSPSGWTYEFTPYLWAQGMKGTVGTATLPSTEMDMSFLDLLEIVKFALAGTFEARNGRWGLLADAQYYKLADDATTSRTGPLGNTLTAHGDVDVKQAILAAAVAYRVSEGRSPVDVIGGLRYTRLDVDVRTDFTVLGLTGGRSRSGSKDWVDPYLGVRLQYPLSDRWAFTGYADVGGFGIGSDLSWQVQAGLDYRVSDKYAVKFGYRVLDMDYDHGGFVYNVRSDGLYLGLGIRF